MGLAALSHRMPPTTVWSRRADSGRTCDPSDQVARHLRSRSRRIGVQRGESREVVKVEIVVELNKIIMVEGLKPRWPHSLQYEKWSSIDSATNPACKNKCGAS